MLIANTSVDIPDTRSHSWYANLRCSHRVSGGAAWGRVWEQNDFHSKHKSEKKERAKGRRTAEQKNRKDKKHTLRLHHDRCVDNEFVPSRPDLARGDSHRWRRSSWPQQGSHRGPHRCTLAPPPLLPLLLLLFLLLYLPLAPSLSFLHRLCLFFILLLYQSFLLLYIFINFAPYTFSFYFPRCWYVLFLYTLPVSFSSWALSTPSLPSSSTITPHHSLPPPFRTLHSQEGEGAVVLVGGMVPGERWSRRKIMKRLQISDLACECVS